MSNRSLGNRNENSTREVYGALGYNRWFKPTHGTRFQKQVDILASEDRCGADFIACKPYEAYRFVQVKTGTVSNVPFDVICDLFQWNFEALFPKQLIDIETHGQFNYWDLAVREKRLIGKAMRWFTTIYTTDERFIRALEQCKKDGLFKLIEAKSLNTLYQSRKRKREERVTPEQQDVLDDVQKDELSATSENELRLRGVIQ